VDPAHTDTDSIIVFPKAKVIHMGDAFITTSYPFVDVSSGGNYDGFVAGAERALGIADDSFKIVPGHGALSTKADLKAWHEMLVGVRARVKKEADAGKSLDAIQKLKVTAAWDDQWGKGFIKPENVVEFAYKSLKHGR
jgi:cyclase